MSPSELDLDTLFDSASDDAVVLDPSVFTSSDESDEEVPAAHLPDVPAVNQTLAAEVPATEVVKIVRKSSDEKPKKGRGGQTAVCVARCDIVRQLFAEAADEGRSVTTSDLMALANGRFKYTDVILVSKQLKAAGKITEALKGRQASWAPAAV
jgi:hypothetical protein